MKYIRQKKIKLLVIFLFFVFMELLLRLFWAHNGLFRQNNQNLKLDALGAVLKQKPKYYQDRFCDSLHQNKLGEKDVATCVLNDIKINTITNEKNEINTIATGASTTHGFNCNSETNWPSELATFESRFKMLNLADDGAYSDNSIIKIEEQLQQNNIPDLLLWGHGFSEFMFYGDTRDINWEVLKTNQILIEDLRKDSVYKQNILLKILRFDITLQNYFYIYKFFRTNFNLVLISIKNGYSEFLLSMDPSKENETNDREKFLLTSGFLGGPVRVMFSESTQNYAVKNYRLNLQRLYELSKKYKFKVACVKLPTVPGLLSYFSIELGEKWDRWLEKISQITDESCAEYGFIVSDVQRCYLNKLEKSQ